jgi:hypothetical protein
MNDTAARKHHPALVALVLACLAVGIGVLLLWGWNTIAVDLFHAPRAKFRHALAAEGVLLAGLALNALLARARHCSRDDERPAP